MKWWEKAFPFLNNTAFRRNWLKLVLEKIPKGETILDAGAGECQYKTFCCHLKYVSQDFGQYDGTGNKKGLQTKNWDVSTIDIVSDITRIPVSSNFYDNVMCTEVLEHVPYPDKAVNELVRILKPGGRLILTAPFCSQTHFSPFHFSTGFNRYWFEKILKDNNTKIKITVMNGNFFDYLAQEMLRLPMFVSKYTKIGIAGYLLIPLLLPLLLLLALLSKMDNGSGEQLCFGYQLIAIKNKK